MPVQEDQLLKDIEDYFYGAKQDDPEYNQNLARRLIEKYSGERILVDGFVFAWIGEFLQTRRNSMALTLGLNTAPLWYGYAMNFVMARGQTMGARVLAALIQTSTDEDTCALVAIAFASPFFADPAYLTVLQTRYEHSEGTSCRMALALALYQCGDERQLRYFMKNGYLMDFEDAAKKKIRDPEERRRTVVSMLIDSILAIVFEDCATNGRMPITGYSASRNWVRKQYND